MEDTDLFGVYRIIREAERKLLALRKESKQELPPIVKAGAPCVWREDRGAWLLHFPIHTTLREVWYGETLRYEVPLKDRHPFTVHLYCKPHGGSCDLTAVHTEDGVTMPHIDSGGACMEVTTAPEALRTLEDYKAMKDILIRHCQGINLMSLYTSNTYWPKEMLASLPEEIVTWLNTEESYNREPIKHLFKSVVDEEWLAEPEPEEDPDPPDYDYSSCDCEACRAARDEKIEIEAVVEAPSRIQAQLIQTQLAQTQGASVLWQIQAQPGPVDPNEIWSI